jgi:aspartyl-tRNA(Asn)/glutamyl-tRNA(Gln) amidotransferase subunit C
MPDRLDPLEVERIAVLARLALTDEERQLYAAQLTRILHYARQIAALPTEGVPPMTRVDEESALERPDEPRPSLPRDAALQNAPDTLAGLFLVPRAITDES